MAHHQHNDEDGQTTVGRSRWVLIGFLLVIGYFLITEHRAHVISYLPFLLLLACPLMHLFMHGDHGGHGGHGGQRRDNDQHDHNEGVR